MADGRITIDTKIDQSGIDEGIKTMQSKLDRAADKMNQVGKKMSVTVTAPIVGLGTVATKSAIDFESAFAGVRKTVDATEEQFAALEKGIRDMAKELPASAAEIAGVAEAAGQLGIETDNILKFTRVMIDLGEATNLTAEQAATELARFANITQMSQKDFDRLGSSIVALGNNFATTEAEIVEMGMRLAGAGSQIGLTEPQIMALATALSSVGIEAEAGGTAMTMVMKKMQNAVSDGGQTLKKFAEVAGLSSKEFADVFKKEPIQALDLFIKGLAESSAAGKNLNEILEEVGIKGIRESDAILRLAGASDILSEAVDLSTKAWEENTALSDEAAQRYATTESQLKIFKNALVDLGVDIGNIIIPVLIDLIEMVKPLVEWFGNLDKRTQKIIVVIGGLAAAIGPLLLIVSRMIRAFNTILPIIKSMKTAFTTILPAIKGAGTAIGFLTSPIGLVIAAVAGLVALIVIYWDEIKAATEAVFGWIADFLPELWEGIKEAVVAIWEGIVEILSIYWERVKENATIVFTAIKDALSAIWEGIRDAVMAVWDTISEYLSIVWDTIKNVASTIWNAIKDALLSTWNRIKNAVSTVFDRIKNTISTIWDTIKNVTSTIWNGIKNTISTIINNIRDSISRVFNTIKEAISKVWNGIKSTTERIWNGIVDSIKGAVNTIIDAINSILGAIGSIKIPLPKIPDWVPGVGGKGGGSIGFPKLPKIPQLARGTDNWEGGFARINEGGRGELVLLPSGTQVIPHDVSMRYAREIGRAHAANNSETIMTNMTNDNRTINISVNADNIDEVRQMIELFTGLKQSFRKG